MRGKNDKIWNIEDHGVNFHLDNQYLDGKDQMIKTENQHPQRIMDWMICCL